MKVTPEDVRKLNLPPESVHKTPSGETFVKSNLQKVEQNCYFIGFCFMQVSETKSDHKLKL